MSIFSNFWNWLFRRKPTIIQPSTGIDRALLIGINTYPGAPLSGCVNDVMDMKSILISKYGFKETDIVILIDRDATTKTIKEKIQWLYGTTIGGRAYFHYSGHGVQVPASDEPDGLAEAICPVDFDWTTELMLTDNQLVDLMKPILPGVRFNWCSDSCHSGDLDRGVPNPNPHLKIPRSMPLPLKIAEIIRERKRKNGIRRTLKALANGRLDVGFISGCRSDQTSADTVIGGKPCGAFTYYLIDSLKKLPATASPESVAKETAKSLNNDGYEQQPVSDGPQQKQPFLR